MILIAIMSMAFYFFFFLQHFPNQPISQNIQKWAQFGDFIGGVTNPFLGILNLILLGYFTVVVKHNEDGRANENLEMNFSPI